MPTLLSVTGTVRVKSEWKDSLDLSDVVDTATFTAALAFANGSGAGQANAHWQGERSLAIGGSDTVPLHQMPATIYGGQGVIQFASVRMICVRNKSATQDIAVAWAPHLSASVRAGAALVLTSPAGWASPSPSNLVVSSSAEGEGTVEYELLVVGVLA